MPVKSILIFDLRKMALLACADNTFRQFRSQGSENAEATRIYKTTLIATNLPLLQLTIRHLLITKICVLRRKQRVEIRLSAHCSFLILKLSRATLIRRLCRVKPMCTILTHFPVAQEIRILWYEIWLPHHIQGVIAFLSFVNSSSFTSTADFFAPSRRRRRTGRSRLAIRKSR